MNLAGSGIHHKGENPTGSGASLTVPMLSNAKSIKRVEWTERNPTKLCYRAIFVLKLRFGSQVES